MTRTVKLTSNRPADETLATLCQEGRMMHDDGINAWQAAHDAAPDNATKVLEDLLIAVEAVYRGETFALPRLVSAREKVRSNPTCAALIRQAEERDDAGE